MFFLEVGWKYRLREEEKKGERGWGEERAQHKISEKSSCYICHLVLSVNPLYALPGDIWGDSGSHILHYGLNPIATDPRGHGWQSACSLFTLKVDRRLIITKRIRQSTNKNTFLTKHPFKLCSSGTVLTVRGVSCFRGHTILLLFFH